MIKYLGTDDSINTCDCCGKSSLKHTVGLDFDGEILHYGVVCAGRALGSKTKNASDVSAAVSRISELEVIKQRVSDLREKGNNVVYGRFYINSRTISSRLQIAAPSDLMIRQIFPARNSV